MTKQEFLASLDLFKNLSLEELADLARIAEEYQYPAGAVVGYQRDPAERAYLVREGRVTAQAVNPQGEVQSPRHFMAGQLFEESWLFSTQPYPATYRTAMETRLLVIKASDFARFLERHKGVLARLQLSDQGRMEAERSRMAQRERKFQDIQLLPDELIEFRARRNAWMFFLRGRSVYEAYLPLLGILIMPAVGGWFLEGVYGPGGLGIWSILLPMGSAFVFALIMGFFMLDWINDYFLVTTKHVVHYEFNLQAFRTTVHKVPVERVQSVEVEMPNLFSTLTNVGTARITTAATAAPVRFDYITNPKSVQEAVNSVRQRTVSLDASRAQATMRSYVESHFQVTPPYSKVEEPASTPATAPPARRPAPSTAKGLAGMRRALSYRVEKGGVVTYRKHVIILLPRIGGQAVFAALLVTAYLVLRSRLVLPGYVPLAFLVVSIVNLGWLIWNFEDWRNDLYQLTDRFVLDIDRKPFGFGESRKQAELGSVQNVNTDRTGFFPTIFNYGNVEIETAGTEANIVFESVTNPTQVQNDVFMRRDQYLQNRRLLEAAARRKEYALALDVYQQVKEQERIPRRTPPAGF
ncbi:MAG: cyclic nucleotide-binding domain-containing protein [Chloroflexota bacterium]